MDKLNVARFTIFGAKGAGQIGLGPVTARYTMQHPSSRMHSQPEDRV